MEKNSLIKDILIGSTAGIAATVLTGKIDEGLSHFVSKEQKRSEKKVRKGSPHELAGPYFAKKLTHKKKLTKDQRELSKRLFNLSYGILWGATYSLTKRKLLKDRPLRIIGFGVLFYGLCDGLIAPLLKLSPSPKKIPWQINAKEFSNHIAWTAGAEALTRYAQRR